MAATAKTLGNGINSPNQAASISELSRLLGIDRGTVNRRLYRAGLQPILNTPLLKKYETQAAIAALSVSSAPPVDHDYRHARAQKVTAEAARILLKLQLERGELAPVAELREQAFLLVKAMHQRFSRYARESRNRLFRAKTPTEVERILATDFALIFDDLKRDYPNIL
jgi:hypothetical protein